MPSVFKVTAEFDYFVSAENEDAAWLAARSAFTEAARNECDFDVTVDEVDDIKRVPREWRNSYPYGDGPEMTCEQIMAANT